MWEACVGAGSSLPSWRERDGAHGDTLIPSTAYIQHTGMAQVRYVFNEKPHMDVRSRCNDRLQKGGKGGKGPNTGKGGNERV